MVEKVVSGYEMLLDARVYRDHLGEFHRDNGPAIIDPDGVLSWYYHGKFMKSINIQDDDKQIEDLLSCINFNKIHSAMQALEWKWSFSANESRVPTIDEIIAESYRLLQRCKEFREMDEPWHIATGGLEASAWKAGFTLRFVLEEFTTS